MGLVWLDIVPRGGGVAGPPPFTAGWWGCHAQAHHPVPCLHLDEQFLGSPEWYPRWYSTPKTPLSQSPSQLQESNLPRLLSKGSGQSPVDHSIGSFHWFWTGILGFVSGPNRHLNALIGCLQQVVALTVGGGGGGLGGGVGNVTFPEWPQQSGLL